MKLTVVGCSGSFPSTRSPCSCYLVEHDGYRVLLDLGNGSLGALQTYTGLEEINAVVLSHLHADHCVDLCAYYVYLRYHPGGSLPKVPVYAPAGAADRLTCAGGLNSAESLTGVFDFETLRPGSFGLGPLRMRATLVNHPVETYGIRLDADGRSLTYSADTGESDALVALADRTDLLVCEAAYTEGRDTHAGVHLNGREAGEHARRASARRLVLTHLPPWTDADVNLKAAVAAYGGDTTLAASGAVYHI